MAFSSQQPPIFDTVPHFFFTVNVCPKAYSNVSPSHYVVFSAVPVPYLTFFGAHGRGIMMMVSISKTSRPVNKMGQQDKFTCRHKPESDAHNN